MLRLQHQVQVPASKETIWEILIDAEKWHLWDKDVHSAKLYGPFAKGTKGTLIAKDLSSSAFYITAIHQYKSFSNFYIFPFLTKLNFTHDIKSEHNSCTVTFRARFSGPLSWYYYWKLNKAIKLVMHNAMENLITYAASKSS